MFLATSEKGQRMGLLHESTLRLSRITVQFAKRKTSCYFFLLVKAVVVAVVAVFYNSDGTKT
jgi:hypothetical protein